MKGRRGTERNNHIRKEENYYRGYIFVILSVFVSKL